MRDVIRRFISMFTSGGHLVQWSGIILAISVQGHETNMKM